MKQTIAKEATFLARDWVTLTLAGLGVTLPVHEYLGGLLLALASASFMARHRKDPLKLWVTLGTGGLFATLVAIFYPATGYWVPVQAAMALSGFGSRWGMAILAQFFTRLETKSGPISDRIIGGIFPKDPDDRNDEDNR